jgi:hypothetical protein
MATPLILYLDKKEESRGEQLYVSLNHLPLPAICF